MIFLRDAYHIVGLITVFWLPCVYITLIYAYIFIKLRQIGKQGLNKNRSTPYQQNSINLTTTNNIDDGEESATQQVNGWFQNRRRAAFKQQRQQPSISLTAAPAASNDDSVSGGVHQISHATGFALLTTPPDHQQQQKSSVPFKRSESCPQEGNPSVCVLQTMRTPAQDLVGSRSQQDNNGPSSSSATHKMSTSSSHYHYTTTTIWKRGLLSADIPFANCGKTESETMMTDNVSSLKKNSISAAKKKKESIDKNSRNTDICDTDNHSRGSTFSCNAAAAPPKQQQEQQQQLLVHQHHQKQPKWKKNLRSRQKLFNNTGLLVVVYLGCWLPYFVCAFLPSELKILAVLIAINSALDPMIYAFKG